MIERVIIYSGILFGTLAFPTLFRSPSPKLWIPLYIMSCLNNYFFDKLLVRLKKVSYPVRLFPKITEINIVYDFLVCPFLSVWYCQATYHSKPIDLIVKTFLFGIPQGLYEIFLERKTNTLKFKNNWKWYYSVYLVFVVKILSSLMFKGMKKYYVNHREIEKNQ